VQCHAQLEPHGIPTWRAGLNRDATPTLGFTGAIVGTLFLYLTSIFAAAAFFGLALFPTSLSVAGEIAGACVVALCILLLVPGRVSRLLFITACAWVVIRYMAWRVASLPLDNSWVEAVGAILLFLAECYGTLMLLLGLFVNAYPLDRKPTPLPRDKSLWPTVDIYIPTYSEPVSVVMPTLLAAMDIDYPKDKVRVFVLDDGHPRSKNPNTPPDLARELKERSIDLIELCSRHGATWLTREKNEHAKSGNLNAAMAKTQGEFILILDADHVPTKDILKNTMGLLLTDDKLAFVQTPHFFVNPDPVERNLKLFNRIPAENDMFYRSVQKGLDLWNTSFFCGSAAVLRRTAIDEVGGFSYDSITEDASTSVKMHQKGWRSAYLGIPMVAGLQPETFSSFIVQRLRWAMGMMQIFVKQNPLIIRGLTLAQRLSYLSVIVFWLFPFARIIFFLAPLASIFFDMTVYPVGPQFFLAYTLPYLFAVILSSERSFGRVRRIFFSEIYETLQAFYTLPALVATLLRPSAPTFKVTPKGERLDEEFISDLSKPFYFFFAITLVGAVWGIARMYFEPSIRSALALSVGWVAFNLLLLLVSLGVLLEKPQRRARPRIPIGKGVKIEGSFGLVDAVLVDVSEVGARVKVFSEEISGNFNLHWEGQLLPCRWIEPRGQSAAKLERVVLFEPLTPEQERLAVSIGYSDSARWDAMWTSREASWNVLGSIVQTIQIGLSYGMRHISKLLPKA
jgi:cellulose synthase (UDP-forming)